MWLVVSKLDKATTRRQLGRFVSTGLRPGWAFFPYPSRGAIRRCEILQIVDKDNQTIEYHGLVQIEPVKSALTVISRLNGSKFRGKTMEVSKFQRRSSPDRRAFLPDIGWRSATSKERRNRERRRANIQSSLGKAARIHGIDGL